jgi:hypothetical protein
LVKVKFRRYAIYAMLLCIFASFVSAEKILFYEVGTTTSIQNSYSKFADTLRKSNYEVASIEKGELTNEKLKNYDVLVVQNLNRQLTNGEISALIKFVLQDGKAIFISGGGQSINQLTIPFGTTIDAGTLIDTTTMIPGTGTRTNFIVSDFPQDNLATTIRRGITSIGFYEGGGVVLSGGSKCIARCGANTYSDTGSFPAGSRPCIASASLFGGGLIVIVSDPKLLSNDHIEEYNNRQFGKNIVEWLTLASKPISEDNSTQSLQITIKEKRLENFQLKQDLDRERAEKATALSNINELSLQLSQAQNELAELKEGMYGPFSRTNWAIIILGVCLLVGSIVYSQKRGASAEVKDEDILDELGYELDDKKGGSQPGGSKQDELEKELKL